jgi:hypothetical protein
MRPSETNAVTTAFSCLTDTRFKREHILGLLDGSLGAVRVRELLSPKDCESIAQAFSRIPFGTYDAERVNPPIARFGPSLNDCRYEGGLDESYWKQVERTRSLWQEIAMDPDPFTECANFFVKAWEEPVQNATVGGKGVHAGVLREINGGALVHFDDVNREFPSGLFDSPVTGQLAFNVYISTTTSGGETVVWHRPWRKEDEGHRRGYGYDEEVTAGAHCVTINPEVGDGLLFNPRNLHAVRPTQGGSRIAFAFFLGVTAARRLIMWS